MLPTRTNSRDLTLVSLEEIAVSARAGFACMFSTSDEYEAALISERRAEGRYRKPNPWPAIAWGCAVAAIAAVLLVIF
jgi:choline-glycine betaine transporter